MSSEVKPKNFLSQFRDGKTNELRNLTAVQFMEVWKHYDRDGNGFIEGRELDKFLREFILSINPTDEMNPTLFSESTLADLKDCFMEAYDDNKDGKIEIRELAQLLPLEESFLLLFRFDNPLDSSVEFMKIWREYDTDNSGFIEADELKNFLRDLMREANRGAINEDVDEDKLIEYTDTLLQIFDTNKDGKLQLSEMAKLLPVKENFLCRSNFIGTKLTQQDIETVFALYDRDNNGTIENEELKGFLKDLLELVKKDYDAQDLEQFQRSILKGCDLNKDGKINKKELTMVLLALAQHAQEEEESIDDKVNLNHRNHQPNPNPNHNQNGSHVNHTNNIKLSNNNNSNRTGNVNDNRAENSHHPNNKSNDLNNNHHHQIVTVKSNDKK